MVTKPMAEALAIRIMVQNGNVVKAELKGIGEAGQTSMAKIQRGSEDASAGLQKLSIGSIGVGTALKTLGGAFSAYLALDVARKVAGLSDSYTNLQTKLHLATGSTQEAAYMQKQLFDIAQATRQPIDELARTYQRLAPAFRDAGVAGDQQMQVMNLLGKSMMASGATAGEAASSLLQLSQAMGKGRLNGDELRSMMENWPALMRRVAEAFGVPVGLLTSLGEQGVITSDKFLQAVLAMNAEIEADAAKVRITLEQAQVQLRNDIEQTIGRIAQQSGVTNELVDAVVKLREAINSPEFQRGATVLAEAFAKIVRTASEAFDKISSVIKLIKELGGYLEFFSRVSKASFGGIGGLINTDNETDKNAKRNIFDIVDAFNKMRDAAREAANASNLAARAAAKPNFVGIGNFRDAQDYETANRLEFRPFGTEPVARPGRNKNARVQLDYGAGKSTSGKSEAQRALEQAAKDMLDNERVIDDLLRKLSEVGSERDKFIRDYANKLNDLATPEEIEAVKRYAAAEYDRSEALKASKKAAEDQATVEAKSIELNKEHATAAQKFIDKMRELDDLRRKSQNTGNPLSPEAYDKEKKKINDEVRDTNEKVTENYDDAYKRNAQIVNSFYRGVSDGLADMIVDNEMSFENMLKSMMKSMLSSGIQQGLAQLFGTPATGTGPGQQGTTGLITGLISSIWGGRTAHTGGVMGVDTMPIRHLPAAVWAGAPRYHQGYFAPGEYPAILQKGESVLTPGQMRQVAGAGGGISVEINNYSSERVSAQQNGAGGLKVTIGQMVATAIMDRASPANRAIQGMIDKSGRGR